MFIPWTIIIVVIIALIWAISVYLHKRLKKRSTKIIQQPRVDKVYKEENAFITDVTQYNGFEERQLCLLRIAD